MVENALCIVSEMQRAFFALSYAIHKFVISVKMQVIVQMQNLHTYFKIDIRNTVIMFPISVSMRVGGNSTVSKMEIVEWMR